MREFEVTLLTTRCGTTVVRVAAADRGDVLRVVDRELSSGEHIAPPEHCTDDVQTEVCAIREIHSEGRGSHVDTCPSDRSAGAGLIVNIRDCSDCAAGTAGARATGQHSPAIQQGHVPIGRSAHPLEPTVFARTA